MPAGREERPGPAQPAGAGAVPPEGSRVRVARGTSAPLRAGGRAPLPARGLWFPGARCASRATCWAKRTPALGAAGHPSWAGRPAEAPGPQAEGAEASWPGEDCFAPVRPAGGRGSGAGRWPRARGRAAPERGPARAAAAGVGPGARGGWRPEPPAARVGLRLRLLVCPRGVGLGGRKPTASEETPSPRPLFCVWTALTQPQFPLPLLSE